MKVLVTGGGGFLGGAIIDRCVQRGWDVRSFARGDYPHLVAKGVEVVRGDLADLSAVEAAVQGCEAVFHVAALAGMWGDYQRYFDANVLGTRNVLAACHKHGVQRLVYTSSPSVVQRYESIEGADERLDYPDSHHTHYQATKALAEREVVAASCDALLTVSLRPRMIWGPGDTQIAPRVIDRRRSGRLKLVGDGSQLVDSIHIDNAALGHMLALDALQPGAACVGKVYFLTNGEPWPLAKLMNAILSAADEQPVTATVSPRFAWVAGSIFEAAWRLFGIKSDPPMTRFLARQLCTANWFDISAARRDLGYQPQVSMDEGMAGLKRWYAEHPP